MTVEIWKILLYFKVSTPEMVKKVTDLLYEHGSVWQIEVSPPDLWDDGLSPINIESVLDTTLGYLLIRTPKWSIN